MKPPPKGWPRLSSAVYYQDGHAAIDWLCRAFGFEVQIKIEGEGSRIEHSELVFHGALIMVGEGKTGLTHRKSPKALGGVNTQSLMLYIDDANAHCEKARAAGAKIIVEPKDSDYGEDYWTDRSYEAEDPEGHRWWFVQRLRDPKTS
jgi:uncharacterized glyoxalase superfamily protein PhnB